MAWLHAIWLCAAVALPAVAAPHWDLAPEDLDLALARGDIDADDYERLLDLFRLRQVARDSTDDSVAFAADIGRGDLDSLLESSAAALPRARGTAYEIHQRLRGTATRREWLLFAPQVKSLRMHWELSRSGAGEWRVLRRHAWWSSSRVSIVAGSFDVHWIDGLLIGAAPAFLHKRETSSATLLFPDRGRLNGLLCDLSGLKSRAAVMVSRADDGELAHTVYGLSIARRVAGVRFETACTRQVLSSSEMATRFATNIWGLAAQGRGRSRFASGAVAIAPGDWAAEGKLDFAESQSHRLGGAIWRVGARFRNPLAVGAAESDREPVDYPELERTISSAATGERGGELRLQVGLPGRRSDFALRYWREQPQRSASLRGSAACELGRLGRRWRGEYRVYRRMDGASVRHRHEWSLRMARSRGYCDVKLRRTVGDWSPFGALGGRLEAGLRFGGGSGSRERQSLVLTYNDYDFAENRSAYWAVRLSQAFRFSRAVLMDVNVRWRAAYHAHPADLSLRVTTRGGV